MPTVILRNGFAVRPQNISDVVTDIEGFLSSFTYNSKTYKYFNTDELTSGDLESKLRPLAGYYEVEAYAAFIVAPGDTRYHELTEKYNFNARFIEAETGDNITVKIIEIAPPYTSFYYYKLYSLTHVKGKNYLRSDGRALDTKLLGQGTPQTRTQNSIASGFFTTHIGHISNIPEEDKYKYGLYTAMAALRIGMIIETIFPILLSNPNNVNLIDLIAYINNLKSHWGTDTYYDSSSGAAASYYKFLTALYAACFKYQDFIRTETQENRLKYIVSILHESDLNQLPDDFLIGTLKGLAVKSKLSEAENDIVIKVMMAFDESGPSRIDSFLTKLVSKENGLLYKNATVTLYEKLYWLLKESTIAKIWKYSPLYKKIQKKTGIQDAASTLQVFVSAVYTLWVKSKYNPYRNNVFDENYFGYRGENYSNQIFAYTRLPATSFHFTTHFDYIINTVEDRAPLVVNNIFYDLPSIGMSSDSIQAQFHGFDKIVLYNTDERNIPSTGVYPHASPQNLSRAIQPYGFYHLYQPIQMIYVKDHTKYATSIHTWTESSNQLTGHSYLPAFLHYFLQTKEQDEFISAIVWKLLDAAVDGLPTGKVTKFIDQANKAIGQAVDFFGVLIPPDVISFISGYSGDCNTGGDDFCRRIKILDLWIQNYASTRNEIIKAQLQKSAADLVDVTNGNWPSEFATGIGLDAKTYILNLAGLDVPNNEEDRRNDIFNKIKARVAKEEPREGDTGGRGFSFYKWNTTHVTLPNGRKKKEYIKTNIRQHTDADILSMITYGLNLNAPDHWIEGIITKAFRIAKPKTMDQVESELLNASNLIKPAPGRNNLLYCFFDGGQQVTFENLVEQQYIDKYHIRPMLSEDGELNSTYYGGSVHTKETPPDIDMVSYITDSQMSHLVILAEENLRQAKKQKLIFYQDYKRLLGSIKRGKERQNRVMSYCLGTIVTVGTQKQWHIMSEEYNKPAMTVTINGQPKNIFEHLNLTAALSERFDFVFFTKQDAKNGRSIPPETLIQFT